MNKFKEYYEETVSLNESEIKLLNEGLKDFFKKSKSLERWLNRTIKAFEVSRKLLDAKETKAFKKYTLGVKDMIDKIKDLESKVDSKKITKKQFKEAVEKIENENKELSKLIKKENLQAAFKNIGIPLATVLTFGGLTKLGISGLTRFIASAGIFGATSAARDAATTNYAQYTQEKNNDVQPSGNE